MKKKNWLYLIGTLLLICVVVIAGVVYKGKVKNNRIEELNTYLSTLKENSSQYILEKYEEDFKSLLGDMEEAINAKDLDKAEELKDKLNAIDKQIIDNNITLLSKNLEVIKSIDLSGLSDDNMKTLNEMKNDTENLISNHKFIDAQSKITAINDFISTNNKPKSEENIELSNSANVNKPTAAKNDITIEEAMEYIKKADPKAFEEFSKVGKELIYVKDAEEFIECNRFGIAEEIIAAFTYPYDENLPSCPYIVGKKSGNVYKSISNGGVFFDLIQDGKSIKRYIDTTTYDMNDPENAFINELTII